MNHIDAAGNGHHPPAVLLSMHHTTLLEQLKHLRLQYQ